jgi:hypothetical protein
MRRLVRVFPGPWRPGDPDPPLAPVIDGVPDITHPLPRNLITNPPDRRAAPRGLWVGFCDEDCQCALL